MPVLRISYGLCHLIPTSPQGTTVLGQGGRFKFHCKLEPQFNNLGAVVTAAEVSIALLSEGGEFGTDLAAV